MRLLIAVDGYFPTTGGAEKQALLIAHAMRARGHEVQIVAPLLRPKDKQREMVEGIQIERIDYPKVPVLGALILAVRFAWILLSRRQRFDAVHVHMVKILAAVAGLVRPSIGKVVVAKVSGAWEFEGGILDPELRRRWLYRVLNACVRRIDYIQCISERTRMALAGAGYDSDIIKMVPNAVDLERYRPRREAAVPLRVAYVGRLRQVKGIDVLLRAWAAASLDAGARLAIAGDGREHDNLRALAAELGIGAQVDFLGEVSDVPQVLSAACLYVQPSHQEGLSNAVLEAMASGLPVVATRVSGNEELVKDGVNGYLFAPGDHHALASILKALENNVELLSRMGSASRAFVEQHYGIGPVCSKLEQLYQEPRRA